MVRYKKGMTGDRFLESLNVKKRCAASGVELWQCPQFLFPVMGFVIIVAIIATNVVAQRFTDPEISALIVLVVTAFLFIVGHTIVRSFENIVEASQLKSEFVSIVSHELRSPLTAIRWNLGLLKAMEGQRPLSKDTISGLDAIEEQNKKMTRLINTLLEVRKIEDQKLDFQPSRFSLRAVTEKVVAEFRSLAEASKVGVRVVSPEGLPDGFADPKKITLVVENLMDNAIRYSVGKGEVVITIQKKGNHLLWTIKDQGSGIPKEDAKKLFRTFYKAHNVFRYRGGGLGVGLFLARAFIEASEGKINFLSKEGEGSTFWFTLPLAS